MKSKEMPLPDWRTWRHVAKLSAEEAAALTMNLCPNTVRNILGEVSESGSPALFALVASSHGMEFEDATEFENRLLILDRSFDTGLATVELAALAKRFSWEVPAELADLATPATVEAGSAAGEPAKPAAELMGKERTTVLKLIGGLAICGYGMDIHANRLTGIDVLHADLATVGAPIDQDTLRKWLKLAAEVIDRPSVGKNSAQ